MGLYRATIRRLLIAKQSAARASAEVVGSGMAISVNGEVGINSLVGSGEATGIVIVANPHRGVGVVSTQTHHRGLQKKMDTEINCSD